MKKLLVLMLTVLAVMSVSAAGFPDMPDDWSTEALTAAVENGLISGSDGYILPNDNLTRAEMATVMVRAFGGTEKADISGFTDVPEHEWYYDNMAIAVKMGLFNGNNGMLNPDDYILREEAFVVIARALSLEDADVAVLANFSDAQSVSDWAKGAVSALLEKRYINGSGNLIEPQSKITRAEFAQVMHNIFGKYIKSPGTYTQNIEGTVIISGDNVVLKDCIVSGDVIVADGVVMGASLNNVQVGGRIIFRGGNANSMVNIASNDVLMPVDGTVVRHDVYGSMIGGSDFDIMNYIRLANPGGFLYENGTVISPEGAVMTCGDIEIPFGVYRYYMRALLSQFDGGNNTVWAGAKLSVPEEYNVMNQNIKAAVSDIIIQQHIAVYLMAQENGVDIAAQEKAAADNIAALRSQYGQYGVNLDELMASQGIDSETLLEVETAALVSAELISKLYYDEQGNIIIDEQAVAQYITDNGYMRAQHILVENEETAHEVVKKLEEGADFMELVAQYNTDPGMTNAGEAGYFFGTGEMVAEFENGCKELEEGEISAPVKTAYGYHIIRRLEPSEENITAVAQSLAAEDISAKIAEYADGKLSADVKYSELCKKIEAANLY